MACRPECRYQCTLCLVVHCCRVEKPLMLSLAACLQHLPYSRTGRHGVAVVPGSSSESMHLHLLPHRLHQGCSEWDCLSASFLCQSAWRLMGSQKHTPALATDLQAACSAAPSPLPCSAGSKVAAVWDLGACWLQWCCCNPHQHIRCTAAVMSPKHLAEEPLAEPHIVHQVCILIKSQCLRIAVQRQARPLERGAAPGIHVADSFHAGSAAPALTADFGWTLGRAERRATARLPVTAPPLALAPALGPSKTAGTSP